VSTAHRVIIVGASGYSGGVLARLVASHPRLELAAATSDARAGRSVGRELGLQSDLAFVKNGEALSAAAGCDVAFLATPAEVSAELGPRLAEGGRTVIDLSGAFRLATADDVRVHYSFAHPDPGRLGSTPYGLPELFGTPPRGALVANPGCYPTATLLALAPLLRAGLIEAEGLVVDAKSGTTGAGRQAKEEHSFAEVAENLRAYKVLAHQHEPEIAQKLAAYAGTPPPGGPPVAHDLVFTPHLLPVRRGLLATCYARPRGGADLDALDACLRAAYAGAPFVDVVAPGEVTLAAVVGTNVCRVGVAARPGRVIVIAAIDNLLKGAAGQALQNANLALGLPEAMGLDGLHRSAA